MFVSLGPYFYFSRWLAWLVCWIVISLCVIENCRRKSQNFNNKKRKKKHEEKKKMKINDNISKILYTLRVWRRFLSTFNWFSLLLVLLFSFECFFFSPNKWSLTLSLYIDEHNMCKRRINKILQLLNCAWFRFKI